MPMTRERDWRSPSRSLSRDGLVFAGLVVGALALMLVRDPAGRSVVQPLISPIVPASAPDREQWEKERVHLEGLLQNRINFYLLFSTLLLSLAVQIGDGALKKATLLVGSIVSTVMSLTVLRTTRLVRDVLNKLCMYPTHPYPIIRRSDFWNANYWLAAVVVGITLCLWALFVYLMFAGPWRFSPSPLRIQV